MPVWSCLCGQAGGRLDCPYHAAVAQMALLRDTFDTMSQDVPLFPSVDGGVCKKQEIVRALEATITATGVAITSASGARVFGGHSFRVAGAQRLATIGVDVTKIMILGRWSSATVLRYVQEAPIGNLTEQVCDLEHQQDTVRTIAKLQHQITGLGAAGKDQVEGLRSELASAVRGMQSKFAPSKELSVIARVGGKRHKVRRAAVDGLDVNPAHWKTRCGSHFGGWTFTRHEATEDFPTDCLCARCFAAPGAMSRVGADEPGCSTSSDSGSSEG